MEQNPPSDLNWQTGAPAVSRLVPKTDLRLDFEALARLHAALGPKLAGATLAQAHAELAHQVQAVSMAHADCDLQAMTGAVRRIRRLAVDVGLPEMRRAADHVLDCLGQSDATALAATVARLVRLGDLALSQVGGLRLPGS
jgi:hypothetical protein